MREPGRAGGAGGHGRHRRAPGRLRLLLFLAGAALLVVVPGDMRALSSSHAGRDGVETALVRAIPPAPTSTTAPTATAGTTTTVTPPLPQPAEPPADPYADEPLVVLGTIEIPRIGLSAPLHEGMSLRSIDQGPSHWPGTAMPGQVGNVVVAGHRVTHTRPFRHLDQLQPGDQVVFTMSGMRWTYEVTGSEIVRPTEVRIVDQTPTATATLFACHPPGSARYRYVVHLALADADFAGSGSPG